MLRLHVSDLTLGHHQVSRFASEKTIPCVNCNEISLQLTHYIVCGNKMPTRCNRGFNCRSYCLLNMFLSPLCPSSGAQEYYTVVAACGISCCGFQVDGLVWSSAPHQTSNLKTTARNTTGSNHCIILLSS